MPANYVLLERVTVGEAGASSITFNSIPQTGYTDLKIVVSARDSSTADAAGNLYNISFNGSTTTYTNRLLYGDGASAASATAYTRMIGEATTNASGSTANTFGNGEVYIPNYTSANYKSWSSDGVAERNATNAYAALNAGLWSTTSAITSVAISPNSGSWAQYSTFSLYGLAAVGTTPTKAPKASGGSIIQTDGTYWYHAFLASGTFTPATGLSCDVLVVAGGGGGGGGNTNFGGGGGGGAGGLLGFASQSISTATTITVGSGGAGGTTAGTAGTVGVDSQCGSLTLVKGGGYGAAYTGVGGAGGSGGGSSGTGAGGAATSGQGNAGSSGTQSGSYWGGAGGGAGSAATNASGSVAPTAGAGTNTNATYGSFAATVSATATGVSGYFAGGGGGGNGLGATGGTGGSGGGANAGVSGGADGSAGTANSGGGGGGCSILSAAKNGGKGGSGIVIIRYAV
jgi:hypothetical protein